MERCQQPKERVNVSSTGVEGVTVVDDVTVSSGPCSGEVLPT